MSDLVIGTRGSDLALYQANFIKRLLEEEHDCRVNLKIIKTSGDKIDNISFDQMEGKGFFTKELEDALLDRQIDLAVHSLKDLMTTQPAGLKLGAVGFRSDRREMLLIRNESFADSGLLPVKEGGVVGTSSNRRKCQIAFHGPTLQIKDLRGNVPTRVNKLRDGQYDAIIIAAAGVTRLELDVSDLKVVLLDPLVFLPAPAQAILGIQIREDDKETGATISKLNSDHDATEAAIERGLLAKFDSGCSLPLGVYSEAKKENLILKAVLGAQTDGQWTGLKRIELEGNDVDRLVEQAFTELTSG